MLTEVLCLCTMGPGDYSPPKKSILKDSRVRQIRRELLIMGCSLEKNQRREIRDSKGDFFLSFANPLPLCSPSKASFLMKD